MRLSTIRKLDVPTLRAAWWALRAVRRVRRDLNRVLAGVELPEVPNISPTAERGVNAVLARRGPTCLVRATVRQAWHAAHGSPRDLVIGVTGTDDFTAHAWLDGDPAVDGAGYMELHRLPANHSHARG